MISQEILRDVLGWRCTKEVSEELGADKKVEVRTAVREYADKKPYGLIKSVESEKKGDGDETVVATLEYTTDELGNITKEKDGDKETQYDIVTKDKRLMSSIFKTESGGERTQFTYDEKGNLIGVIKDKVSKAGKPVLNNSKMVAYTISYSNGAPLDILKTSIDAKDMIHSIEKYTFVYDADGSIERIHKDGDKPILDEIFHYEPGLVQVVKAYTDDKGIMIGRVFMEFDWSAE